MSILRDLVFSGKFKKNFVLNGVIFTFSTLSKADEEEITFLEKRKKTHFNTINFVFNILNKTIVKINNFDISKNDLYEIIQKLPLIYIVKLYDGYKDFSSLVVTEINTKFFDFLNSTESDIQWEVLKAGFLFEQPLNEIQKSWIYYRKQLEKNKEFEQQFQLSKYIISHITHASINPKTYVNMIKKEQHQEEAKKLQDQGEYKDLAKEYFDEILSSRKDEKKVNEVFKKSIEEKDEHDLIIFECSKDEFKNTIRYRRNLRFTKQKQKKPDIVIGYKQEVTLESNQDIKINIFVRENVNYEDIFKSKQFFDLPMELKFQLLEEVLLEEAKEVVEKKQNKITTDIPKNGKTIRELLKEKNGK